MDQGLWLFLPMRNGVSQLVGYLLAEEAQSGAGLPPTS